VGIYAQDIDKQLAITEVYLDSKNQEFWIEIFNPTDNELVLNSFRISGIRALNVLPPEIRKQNGIKLKPNEYLVICSDINSFTTKYSSDVKVVEVSLLKNIVDGGFVTINNLDGYESTKKIIRFGEKEKSSKVAGVVGDNEVLTFSNDGMSYSREIKKSREVSGWSKIIPTPGK
jgi:hypothetical protein